MIGMQRVGTALTPLTALTLTALLVGCGGDPEASAQDDTGSESIGAEGSRNGGSESAAASPVRAIPAGTVLVLEVVEPVSTRNHEAGDTFRLRLVGDAQGTGGAYLSAGSEVQGIVTDARESESSDREAVLGVRIQSIRVDGAFHPLVSEVESADTEAGTRDSGQRTAAKIATGAAAGAVIGQILGRDTRSTVVGASVGAAAGTGIALTTREGHAVLPEGSRVTVRLTEPLVLR